MTIIILSIIAIFAALLNMSLSHIFKEPSVIQEVINGKSTNNCVNCKKQCLLKFYLIMNGKKMFDKIIKMQPIITALSVLVIIGLVGMILYQVTKNPCNVNLGVQNLIVQNDVLFLFILMPYLLLGAHVVCYVYICFYWFIFKNLGD